jgi:hypothetical protein
MRFPFEDRYVPGMKFAIGLGVAGAAALLIAIASGRFEGDPAPTATTGPEPSDAERGLPDVPTEHEVLEVAPGARVPVLDAPGGERLGVAMARTESGERTVLSVADRRGEWIGVESALSGVEPVAWVREQRKRLIPSQTRWAIVLDPAGLVGELRRGAEVVEEFGFAEEGNAAAVRPGRYAVADRAEGALVLTATPDPGVAGAPPGPPVVIGGEAGAANGIVVAPPELEQLLERDLIGAPVFVAG